MKLDWRALSLTCAILWAGTVFLMGVANLIWPTYGVNFLQLVASIYPGYNAARSFGEVIIATLYAIVDGFVGGIIFVWLYNCFLKPATKA